jgi:hypothetical protein
MELGTMSTTQGSAKDMSVLEPGRYVVRGGPGGRYAVTQPRADRYAMIGGRLTHFVVPATYTDRWQVLAEVRVRRGHSLTRDGLLGAVQRMWHYGG